MSEAFKPIYYYYSMHDLLAEEAAREMMQKIMATGEYETTQLDGPAPDIEEILVCGGSMSFFGTRRLVYLRGVSPATYSDKALKELFSVIEDTENAIYIVTSTFDDKKQLTGKRVKAFIDFCAKKGYAQEEKELMRSELIKITNRYLENTGTSISAEAQDTLCGVGIQSRTELYNVLDKLAAASGYGSIENTLVENEVADTVEVNVFEILDRISRNNPTKALHIVNDLLALKEEPIKISATLLSGYLDMIRVRTAPKMGGVRKVAEDFHYFGSDYRLRKALELANRFHSANEICRGIHILRQLDKDLKSSTMDAEVQLQTAVCQLCIKGSYLE